MGGGGQKGITIYFHSIFNSNFCHPLPLFTSPGHVTVNVERFVDQKVKGNTNICIFIQFDVELNSLTEYHAFVYFVSLLKTICYAASIKYEVLAKLEAF